MSQHDYDIANQGYPAFRADVNAALQALASLNSGSTAPATKYGNMLWADTSVADKATVKQWDGTDWITWCVVDWVANTVTFSGAFSGTLNGAVAVTAGNSVVFEGATDDAYETTLAVTDPTADRTITLPDAAGMLALLSLAQTWTKPQRGSIVTVTYGSTTTIDFAEGNNFRCTLTGNITTLIVSNLTDGQSGMITFVQDSTGSRTLPTSATNVLNLSAVVLSTAANARDQVPYYVENSKLVFGTPLLNPT